MHTLFQTNFFGTVRITQEVIRKMKQHKLGRVIFVSSIVGVKPFVFGEFYAATNFAIEGLIGCLTPLMRTFNISITSVQPGPVKTEFHTNISENQQGSFSTVDEVHDTETKALIEDIFGKYMVSNAQEWQLGRGY
ncbi:Retinol dehydrogenase 8 [Holothuria leucospilota]|uniref:Retinol dehydrogenase 8 n=1 Tax=Holothuria leucospilota TaxID=206669 RepID=A0A9Q1H343_HOLLE|nr:Retinol dehydrogenase 8 [Holothuria leucospilota]